MRSPQSAVALAAATVALLLFSAPTFAQDGAATARSDPLDVNAKVPAVTYRSSFSEYRPLSNGKLDWKKANDTAGSIGGWRTYAKEAQSPEPPAANGPPADKPAAPPAKPAAGGHDGHKMN